MGKLEEIALTMLKENFSSDLVPMTYEATEEYLDQELVKPEGKQDLHREMCMLIVMSVTECR